MLQFKEIELDIPKHVQAYNTVCAVALSTTFHNAQRYGAVSILSLNIFLYVKLNLRRLQRMAFPMALRASPPSRSLGARLTLHFGLLWYKNATDPGEQSGSCNGHAYFILRRIKNAPLETIYIYIYNAKQQWHIILDKETRGCVCGSRETNETIRT